MAVNGKSRRSYRGAPVSNTLGVVLNAAATSITLATAISGWSTDGEPFFVVVDPGTAKEEKICVKYATTTTLTVVDPAATSTWAASAAGRGADNTTDQSHAQGAVIYPVFTALEANQANELVSKYANAGSVVYQGSGTPGTFTELAIGTASQVLTVNSGGTAPQWSTIVDANVNASAAIALSKLATGALPSAITVASANLVNGTIVDEDINASAAIALSKLATGALPTAITVASANIVNGTIVAEDLASGSVTAAKLSGMYGITYADLSIASMTTSYADYKVTIPNSKSYFDIVNVSPLNGLINDIIYIESYALGDWSGELTPNQIIIRAKLGNAVASTTGTVRFWFTA